MAAFRLDIRLFIAGATATGAGLRRGKRRRGHEGARSAAPDASFSSVLALAGAIR